MTLSEIVDFVCGKVNMSEAEDKVECRKYAQRRHQMIWDDELWKDAVTSVTISVDPSNELTAMGQVFIPRGIERVLAVRSADRKVNVIAPEMLYRVDVDEFSRTGMAYKHYLLQPAVWVKTPSFPTPQVYFTSPSDQPSAKANLVWNNARGEVFNSQVGHQQTLRSAQTIPGQAYPATTPDTDPNEILSFSKQTTNSSAFITAEGDSSNTAAKLSAEETSFVPYQRIRLVNIPTVATTLRVLGKARLVGFEQDQDTPRISGSEDVIIALTQADMLERGRQYGKANLKQQEAAILMEQLKKLEVVQQTTHQRFIPEGGYAWEYQSYELTF